MAKDQGVSVSPDTLREKYNEITSIDEWLDSVSGGTSAGKTAIRNALIKENEATIGNMVDQIVKFLTDKDETVKAGVFFGVSKALADQVGTGAEAFLTAQAEANKSTTEQVSASDEDITSRRAERKELVNQFNALKGILEMFGKQDEIADIPDPKVLRGAIKGAKRAPRKINLMAFSVDGNAVSADQNSLSGVAALVGIKAKELRAALTEAGIDLKNPSDFSATVNGHSVSAVKGADDLPETEEAA